ncbi:MAG: ECF transporter S component [Bacillota bacterium]|nr:ECF transporter S component [Bacillota bacterium]
MNERKIYRTKKVVGFFCMVVFLCLAILQYFKNKLSVPFEIAMVVLFCAAVFFIAGSVNPSKSRIKKINKKALITAVITLFAMIATVLAGVYLFDDRRYYLVSMLIILETMIPFAVMFESRGPKTREIVVIAVMCALAVTGRAAFFMVPQFKPMLAVVIITGIALGGETGFLTGAVSAFVSNMFYGQGSWTPWQMFAMGVVGLISGMVFSKIKTNRIFMSVYGFFAAFAVYGLIMNASYVLTYQEHPNIKMFIATIANGIPFDAIHGGATALFMWMLAPPMLEKLNRIKDKYGLME